MEERILSIYVPIREELEKVELTLQRLIASPLDVVTQVASHIIHSGGKRLRPVLCLLCSKLFKYPGDQAVRMACVCEFIHTATLLHDDVIDHASLRRGKESANALWGNKTSVLVGDYLYCKASSLIAEEKDFKILGMIAETTATTTEGEVLEIVQSNNPLLTEEQYLQIVRCKTGCLIAASSQIGAHIGGASNEEEMRVKEFGYHIGIAFQLADDALDYASSNSEMGKAVGTDLKEGKLTLPLIHTLKVCLPQEKRQILSALESGVELEPLQLKEIWTMIDRYQGIQYTLSRAKEYIQKAKQNLEPLPASEAKQSLIQLAEYIVERRQ